MNSFASLAFGVILGLFTFCVKKNESQTASYNPYNKACEIDCAGSFSPKTHLKEYKNCIDKKYQCLTELEKKWNQTLTPGCEINCAQVFPAKSGDNEGYTNCINAKLMKNCMSNSYFEIDQSRYKNKF